MRITNKKFNKVVSEIIERNKDEYKWRYCAEDVTFSNIEIRKNKNSDAYDIVVSIDEIETPISLIKDMIEEVCDELKININKILVEL